MATDVWSISLKDKTGDDAYPTVDVSGSAVSAVTATEEDGVITITMTT